MEFHFLAVKNISNLESVSHSGSEAFRVNGHKHLAEVRGPVVFGPAADLVGIPWKERLMVALKL